MDRVANPIVIRLSVQKYKTPLQSLSGNHFIIWISKAVHQSKLVSLLVWGLLTPNLKMGLGCEVKTSVPAVKISKTCRKIERWWVPIIKRSSVNRKWKTCHQSEIGKRQCCQSEIEKHVSRKWAQLIGLIFGLIWHIFFIFGLTCFSDWHTFLKFRLATCFSFSDWSEEASDSAVMYCWTDGMFLKFGLRLMNCFWYYDWRWFSLSNWPSSDSYPVGMDLCPVDLIEPCSKLRGGGRNSLHSL